MLKGIRFHEIEVSLIAGLGFFTYGATSAWLTPLLYYFKHSEYELTTSEASLLAVMSTLANLFFNTPGTYLADIFGRKPILMLSAPLCSLGWIFVLTIRSKIVLFVVKFIHGVMIGASTNILTLYISEISSPKDRGSLICQTNTWWHLGDLYMYVMALFFGFTGLTWAALIPFLIFGPLMFWCPESPYYLLAREKHIQAEKVVTWLRHGSPAHPVVTQELDVMSKTVKEEKVNSKGTFQNLFFTRKGRKSLAIVGMLTIVYAMVGTGVISTYVSDTVATLSGNVSLSNYTTVILGSLLVIVTIPSILMTDRLGRRPLLIVSTAASFISFSATAILFYVIEETTVKSLDVSIASYACLIIGMCFNMFGIDTLQTVAVGEFFSTNNRTIPAGLCSVVYTIAEVGCLYLYEYIEYRGALYLNYVIFATFSLLGSVGIYYFLPETKGKTFAEIQASL